eukprot:997287-Amphidinium_carterae.1
MQAQDYPSPAPSNAPPTPQTIRFENIVVPIDEIVNLALPTDGLVGPLDSTLPSAAGHIHVLRMSSQPRWRHRYGCSTVYRIAHDPRHTLSHLLQMLMGQLKLGKHKLCLFYREIQYLDDDFSRPSHLRRTRSIFHSTSAGLAAQHHRMSQFTHLYLHVEWQANGVIGDTHMSRIADDIGRLTNQGDESNLVEGAGGGRKLRIPRDSVTHNAFDSIMHILRDSQSGAAIDGALVRRVLEWEPRLARAVLQTRSHGPKLKLFADALHGMGLTCFATPLMNDADKLEGDTADQDLPQDSRMTTVENVSGPATTHRQTAAPAETVNTSSPPESTAHLVQQTDDRMIELEKRMKAMEMWAHGLDASPFHGGELSAAQAEKLQVRVDKHVTDLVHAQVKQLLASKQEQACDIIIGILPLTKQGLMIEHDLVRAIIRNKSDAIDEIMNTSSIARRYTIFARLLHSSGYQRISEAMLQAARTFEHTPGMASATVDNDDQDDGSDQCSAPTIDYESDVDKAKSDPYQAMPAAKRRGRPPKSTVNAAPQTAVSSAHETLSSTDRKTKMSRMETIEQNIQLLAKHARMYSTLEEKVDCLDEQHAAIGGDMLDLVASIRQVRTALGMSTPLEKPIDYSDNADTATAVTIKLIESRVMALDQKISGNAPGTLSEHAQVPPNHEIGSLMAKMNAFAINCIGQMSPP